VFLKVDGTNLLSGKGECPFFNNFPIPEIEYPEQPSRKYPLIYYGQTTVLKGE